MTAMDSLLDSNTSFDYEKVKLLDSAIEALYSGGEGNKQVGVGFQEAQTVLTRLQQHPESWRLVQVILEHSELENTRLFALSLLTTAIRTRWNVLPVAERNRIPKYLYDLSTSVVNARGSRTLLTKINETLVEVIKRVWPECWQSFIEDLIASSAASDMLNFNNLSILSLFVEDVLDFGDEEIISRRAVQLKQNLLQKFPLILSYTLSVIKSTSDLDLKTKALQCSAHCLKHTPIDYSLQNDIPNLLIATSFDQYETRVLCLQCLTELFTQGKDWKNNGGAIILAQGHLQKLVEGWYDLMQRCRNLSEQSLSLEVPGNLRQFWESFYLNLALCVLAFHKYFFPLVVESEYGSSEQQQLIYDSVKIMRQIILVPNDECMSVCVEFWLFFSKRFDEAISPYMFDGVFMNQGTNAREIFLYRLYQPILHDVRRAVIEHMAKPPEVYVTYDEETGCAIGCKYQQRDDTEELSLYASLKDTLVHLTRIEPGDTESICLEILKSYNDTLQNSRSAAGLDDRQWNVQLLCKLCWSIGSISGILPKELPFLLTVLKSLLNFCQVKSGKESKALIASMIMYVMGQYPKYLKQNDQLLLVVVEKNLEFMDELFPGVQDMACETFFKVAQGCADKLAVVRTENPAHTMSSGGGSLPYIVYICNLLPTKASKFTSTKLTLLVYSATSLVIAAHPSPDQRIALLQLMMKPLNDTWQAFLPQIRTYQDPNAIPLDTVRTVSQVIGINNCAAEAMANTFALSQFNHIIGDMLSLYEDFGVHITRQIEVSRLNFAITKEMRAYRKSVLRLLISVIDNCEYVSRDALAQDPCKELIEQKIIPYVIERVFMLYPAQNELIRDHEVMMLGSSIINKKSDEQVTLILLQKVFLPSLEMIRKDYIGYPEIRKEFFLFVKNLIQKSFGQILGFLQTFVLSLVFGIQHQNPEFGLLALKGLSIFLQQVQGSDDNLIASFMDSCYSNLLSEIFNVMTDTSHQYGFQQQAQVLYKMMLFAQKTKRDAVVAQWLNEFLLTAFPHLGKPQAQTFAVRFIQSANEVDCRRSAKDLLITLKEFAAKDE